MKLIAEKAYDVFVAAAGVGAALQALADTGVMIHFDDTWIPAQ